MTKVKADDPCMQDLRIEDVTVYLKQSGWKLIEHPNNNFFMFLGPESDSGKPIKLSIPRFNDFLDRTTRLSDAINLLAAIEEESPDTIIQKIQFQSRDLLKLRLPAADSVSLESVTNN